MTIQFLFKKHSIFWQILVDTINWSQSEWLPFVPLW